MCVCVNLYIYIFNNISQTSLGIKLNFWFVIRHQQKQQMSVTSGHSCPK